MSSIVHAALLVWALTASTLLLLLLLAKVINQPQPVKRDVREKKTQPQCIYTFVRKVEHLRFQVLPEENPD